MSWFGLREWHFSNWNILQLHERLTVQERTLFEFDMRTIDWFEYFQTYLNGIRRFVHHDCVDEVVLRGRQIQYQRFVLLILDKNKNRK